MLALIQGGVVVLAIGILIFVHELGHFLAAKKVGIKVEAFSLGFGPKVWGFTRGDTIYKLSLIPLGGYVKMAGEFKEDGEVGTGEEFFDKTIAQRTLVVSAGVIMNVLFAIIAFPLAFSIGVPFDQPVIGSVVPGGPAWEAGIRAGDRVRRIDEDEIIGFSDIQTNAAFNGDPKTFVLERGGEEIERTVVPEFDESRGLFTVGVRGRLGYVIDRKAIGLPAGLEPGDEIVAVEEIPTSLGLFLDRGFTGDDEKLSFTVKREGTADPIEVVVPAEFTAAEPERLVVGLQVLDLEVAGIATGTGGDRSIGQRLGLAEGDVLVSIGGRPTRDRASLLAGLLDPTGETKGRLDVRVRRGDSMVDLAVDDWDGDAVAFFESVQRRRSSAIVVEVLPGSAAHEAGMKSGDVVTSYAGKTLASGEAGWSEFLEMRKEMGSEEVPIVVSRGGEAMTFRLGAAPAVVNVLTAKIKARPIQEDVQVPFPDSIVVGFDQCAGRFKSIMMTLKSLIFGKVAAKNLGGIITIAVVSYTFVEQGLGKILFFMAFLSLNLAVLNILPIPVLDGGHLVFLLLEKIKGGPVSERVMGYANMVGLVLILGLMVFVTFHDIRRFFF